MRKIKKIFKKKNIHTVLLRVTLESAKGAPDWVQELSLKRSEVSQSEFYY